MKTFVRTFSVLVFLFAFLGDSQTPTTITLTASLARPGAPLVLLVTLASGTPPAAVQWFLPTQPGITAIAGAATIAAGKSLVCQTANGLYGCVVSGGINTLPDGVLAAITITAPSATTPFALTNTLGASATVDSIPIMSGALLTFTPLSPCDINGDGKTDLLDARNVIDQIEGVIPATTNLTGSGKTSIVDLQRVINATLDGGCKVGA